MDQQIQLLLQRLQEFKSDQCEYWEEVKQISEEEDQTVPLNVILEENEDECNSSDTRNQLNSILALVNHLREGEIKIVERYKYELKQLALEIKGIQINKKCINTQTDFDSYELLYYQERQRSTNLERQLQEFPNIQYRNDDIHIELASLKNKIQILTETSAEAETLLIKKDQQVKELQKQISKVQRELTQKRSELSSISEQLRAKEVALQMSQSMNRNYELEAQKKKQNSSSSRSSSQSNHNNSRKAYESLAMEVQDLTHQNQSLKKELVTLTKKNKELYLENQQKETKLIEVLNQIDEVKSEMMSHQDKDIELQEVMDYLEMKDQEIERLHYELETYKRNSKDNQQIKDLQNLLLVMSRNLQEKELLLQRYNQ